MKLKKEVVAEVVAEASRRMSDANYAAVLVGAFVEHQTPASQFISAHEDELGGAEAIIGVIFHAALVAAAFERGSGRTARPLSYEDLDAVAQGDALAKLATAQPAMHEFITSNVEHPASAKLLALLALAFDHAL